MMKKCSIDKQLLPVKAIYFMMMGGLAVLVIYIPVFMSAVIGLNTIEIAIIISSAILIAAPVRILFGHLADHFNRRSGIYVTCCFLSVVFFFCLYFVPGRKKTYIEGEVLKLLLVGNDSFSNNDIFSNNITMFTDDLMGSNLTRMNKSNNTTENMMIKNKENVNPDAAFLLFCFLFVLAQAVSSPIQNILDSLIYDFLGENKKSNFGKTRMFGSLGFGIMAIVSGFSIDSLKSLGFSEVKTYLFSFVGYSSIVSCAALLAVCFIKKKTTRKSEKKNCNNTWEKIANDQEAVAAKLERILVSDDGDDVFKDGLEEGLKVCNNDTEKGLIKNNSTVLNRLEANLGGGDGEPVLVINNQSEKKNNEIVYSEIKKISPDFKINHHSISLNIDITSSNQTQNDNHSLIKSAIKMQNVNNDPLESAEKTYKSSHSSIIANQKQNANHPPIKSSNEMHKANYTSMKTEFTQSTSSDNKGNFVELLKILGGFYLITISHLFLVAGIFSGCLENFFYLYLDSLGGQKNIIGFSVLVSCLCETVVLFYSGTIMNYLGRARCFYLVFSTYAIRFLAISFISNPWWGLVTDASQCICFGLLYPVVTSWASVITPDKYQSTIQCYLGTLYCSLGRAIGAAISGYLYERYSPQVMFRFFSICSIVYTVLLIINFEVVDKIRIRKEKQKNAALSNITETEWRKIY